MVRIPAVDTALPGLIRVFDQIDKEQVSRSALILALSLQLYFREQGHFPKTLDELVKAGYLKAIPTDPFAKGRPVQYQLALKASDGAILWSVGFDGVDQGGKPAEQDADQLAPGDIVFHINIPRKAAH
jgi:hypothetical protein